MAASVLQTGAIFYMAFTGNFGGEVRPPKFQILCMPARTLAFPAHISQNDWKRRGSGAMMIRNECVVRKFIRRSKIVGKPRPRAAVEPQAHYSHLRTRRLWKNLRRLPSFHSPHIFYHYSDLSIAVLPRGWPSDIGSSPRRNTVSARRYCIVR